MQLSSKEWRFPQSSWPTSPVEDVTTAQCLRAVTINKRNSAAISTSFDNWSAKLTYSCHRLSCTTPIESQISLSDSVIFALIIGLPLVRNFFIAEPLFCSLQLSQNNVARSQKKKCRSLAFGRILALYCLLSFSLPGLVISVFPYRHRKRLNYHYLHTPFTRLRCTNIVNRIREINLVHTFTFNVEPGVSLVGLSKLQMPRGTCAICIMGNPIPKERNKEIRYCSYQRDLNTKALHAVRISFFSYLSIIIRQLEHYFAHSRYGKWKTRTGIDVL